MGDMPFLIAFLAATQCYTTVNNMQQSDREGEHTHSLSFYYSMSSSHKVNAAYFRTHYQSFSWNLGRFGILFGGRGERQLNVSFCSSYNLSAQQDFSGVWKRICHLFSGSIHEPPLGSLDWTHRYHLPWRKSHPCWKSGPWESRVAIVWKVRKKRLFDDRALL